LAFYNRNVRIGNGNRRSPLTLVSGAFRNPVATYRAHVTAIIVPIGEIQPNGWLTGLFVIGLVCLGSNNIIALCIVTCKCRNKTQDKAELRDDAS
jgi:hypothetical protein